MITVTMDQIVNFYNAGSFLDNTNLPLKGAYKINKLRKSINTEFEYYHNKFQEILDKYAQKDENGEFVFSEDEQRIMIQNDMIDECNNALVELQSLEIEVDNSNLRIEDLGDIRCTPNELEILMPFIEN